VIATKTVTGQYGSSTVLQQVKFQSDQQCMLLGVHTSLCGAVEHWQLRGVVSQNWGTVRGVNPSLTVCKANANSPEPAKFQNSIFSPSKCRPLPATTGVDKCVIHRRRWQQLQ